MHDQLPSEIAEKSPATRLVYLALEDSVHDQDSLVDSTGLSKRHIRSIANDLVDEDLITAYKHPDDQRRMIYYDPTAFDALEAHQTYTKQQSEN